MGGPESIGAENHPQVPCALPALARHLTLTLTAAPPAVRGGVDTRLPAVLINLGEDPVTVTVQAWPTLLWDANAPTVIGGVMGWWHMTGKAISIDPKERLDLHVNLTTRRWDHAGPPIPQGMYRLQAYCFVRLETGNETCDGWIVSPFYPLTMLAPM